MSIQPTQRSYTCSWEDPYALAGELVARPPLDGLQAMAAGELPQSPVERLLGFRGVSVQPGEVVIEGQPSERLVSHRGIVNGGWCLTLIYAAAATAIESTLEPGYGIVVVQQNAQLVRHVLAGAGPVYATGSVRHCGRTLATAEAQVRDRESGKLLAEGTVTAIVQSLQTLLGTR